MQGGMGEGGREEEEEEEESLAGRVSKYVVT